MRIFQRCVIAALICFLCAVSIIGCETQPAGPVEDTNKTTESQQLVTNTPGSSDVTSDDTPASETVGEDSTSDDTTAEDTTAAVTVPAETTGVSGEDTTANVEPIPAPEFLNPLTGLAADRDLSTTRPVAIMVNNIRVSCPQAGVSQADVMYECLVEGGYTRLMMLVMDYESLGEVGSVRSSRDYYLDFAADYDAIYVHAGGSPFAYQAIKDYAVNNLDGVNMYLPSTFYRNQDRIVKMGYEHSMMTTGENIISGIKYKKYRTDLTANFNYPLDFVDYGTSIHFDDTAEHIRIPYSIVQTTDFLYDEELETYLRFQFSGEKHIDGDTGEQLTFENVMILFCETGAISGDAQHRIEVKTLGSGTGYYATKGTYIPITWEKETHESPIRFFDQNGEALLMNAGKTFISVCPTNISNMIDFNIKD